MTGGTDVIVVGAGPAGLAAASTAAEFGLSVLLLDEQPGPGGQVWRQAERIAGASTPADRILAKSYKGANVSLERAGALEGMGLTVRHRATLVDVGPGLDVTWLEAEPGDHHPGHHRLYETPCRALIVATGALERPLPFPGWTLPGVMGVGALQTALKSGGLLPDAGVVLAGHGPLLMLYLSQVLALGGRIDAILDLSVGHDVGPIDRFIALLNAPGLVARGIGLIAGRILSGVPVYRDIEGLRAEGRERLECVRFRSRGVPRVLDCSVLGIHDGVIPSTQLSRLLNLDHRWEADNEAFVPVVDPYGRSSDPRIVIAGDAAGIAGADQAPLSGALAAIAVATDLGGLPTDKAAKRAGPLLARRRRSGRARRVIDRLYPPLPVQKHLSPGTTICRCEGVTAAAIRDAIGHGATGPNRIKTFTRCGMGACQGRLCGPSLVRLAATETGKHPDEVGALRIRSPLKPILLGDYLDDPVDTSA